MASEHKKPEDIDTFDIPDSDLPPLPEDEDESYLDEQSNLADSHIQSDGSALLDKETRRKLMDMESSFLPEPSISIEAAPPTGADDTYLFGGSPGNATSQSQTQKGSTTPQKQRNADISDNMDSSLLSGSPATPADAYKTPGPAKIALGAAAMDDNEQTDESSFSMEPIPSSPSAAAAKRMSSREIPREDAGHDRENETEEVPRPSPRPSPRPYTNHLQVEDDDVRPTSSASTVKAPEFSQSDLDQTGLSAPAEQGSTQTDLSTTDLSASSTGSATSSLSSKRPNFLHNRQASQRSSMSSFRSDLSLEASSEVTLGADYALQSGGAAPSNSHRPSVGLSRLPSLGSIASSVSGYSEASPPERSRAVSGILERLDEERTSTGSPPATPRPPSAVTGAPTDTIIAQHVKNIQVPDTVAREYREKHMRSPEKINPMSMSTPFRGSKHNLTLKEQNSKIDKLTKENFDLKLKIHFLDQALQNRSDESVKEMISKNVQLQTDLANEKKENQTLRKNVRDLERKLKAQEDGLAAAQAAPGSDDGRSDGSSRHAEMEEEITILRELLQETESHVDKLREENLAKEVEKRRMAEYIKSMGDRGHPEPVAGMEEAIDMWKDLLETETARREQADEDAQKLREEISRLKAEAGAATGNSQVRNIYNISKRNTTSYTTRSQSGGSDGNEQNGTTIGSSTLVDQLRHENAELRRDLGAQTSMLTSRNRERERLQQEIEDLKINARRGDGVRSVAGDSIFERSISRAHQRSASRTSGNTNRDAPMSEGEREEYENRTADLRDEIAQTKLVNQDLERELNAHLDILQQMETEQRALREEKDLITEDLQALQAERDEALLALQDKENECEEIREEALGTIERLEAEMDQKQSEINQLEAEIDNRVMEVEHRNAELDNKIEDFNALQQELRTVSESLIQLEDGYHASQRRNKSLAQELEDANRELEALETRIRESATKIERLEVQLESTQSEVTFLREEQEGDKIKIGELEAALIAAQTTIQDEKERYRELEDRLAEERRQRELLDSQEKEEVQKAFHELNYQASKAKDEVRRLRKGLSTKEVEATTWKQRLEELEGGLRETLGNGGGTRVSLFKDITKLQRDLESTVHELEISKNNLAEKDRLLKNRDALLETTGLESRRLSDMLEKERQIRKQERVQFEQVQRTHHNVSRTVQQQETRVLELETARTQERRKVASLEQQYRDQLLERNNLLLALWNRLSTLCGADWAQRNSLINGELPSIEVIARNLPGFNKNIILAVKAVETLVGSFRSRVRNIEKDLWKEYQTLEHNLDIRSKRLDHLEKSILANRRDRSQTPVLQENSELMKLRGENKALKAEIQVQKSRSETRIPSLNNKDANRASVGSTILRQHSTDNGEAVQKQEELQRIQSMALQPSERLWIHRLKELERRLKAEREARLLDRSGARKRLEEAKAENQELRAKHERELERRESLD